MYALNTPAEAGNIRGEMSSHITPDGRLCLTAICELSSFNSAKRIMPLDVVQKSGRSIIPTCHPRVYELLHQQGNFRPLLQKFQSRRRLSYPTRTLSNILNHTSVIYPRPRKVLVSVRAGLCGFVSRPGLGVERFRPTLGLTFCFALQFRNKGHA